MSEAAVFYIRRQAIFFLSWKPISSSIVSLSRAPTTVTLLPVYAIGVTTSVVRTYAAFEVS